MEDQVCPLNILFLTPWFPIPLDNGSKIRTWYLLRYLTAQHDVTLISFAFGTATPEKSSDSQQICRSVHIVRKDPTQHSDMGLMRTFLSLTPQAAHTIPEMSELIESIATAERFDGVVASTMTMSPYALNLPGMKFRVLEEHNSLSRWMHERLLAQTTFLQRIRCWVSWLKARRFEAWLYRQFDLVTMVSNEDYRAVSNMLSSNATRLAVVPNGVDCQHNRPGIVRPIPYTLVYNGALGYAANYDAMRFFLGEIYPTIRRECPRVELSITGATNGVDLQSLPLDPSVQLTGFVEDIRQVVAGAWVMVAPIREGGGSRLKILEAMALGTPVVATRKGAEGLDMLNGVHLLIADDPESFAQATVRLLQDTALRKTLVRNARELVKAKYDWTHIGPLFVSHIQRIADQNKWRAG
jgi:glycosyltransferase involved in cell wall biosynthesis